MISELSIRDVSIAYCPINECSRLNRREKEKEAVDKLVKHLCGANAVLGHDSDGAPIISDWHISISHSRNFAAVAICKTHCIGIDLEEPREEMLKRVARKFLSEEELSEITDLLKAWTIKEAIYKASGVKNLAFQDGIKINQNMLTAATAKTEFELFYFSIQSALLTLAIPSFKTK